MRYGPGIGFDYRPPRRWWRWARGLALPALAAPWLSAAPRWSCLLLDVLMLLALWREHRRRRQAPLRRIVWLGDGRWLLDPGGAGECVASLRQSWRWGRQVILLLALPEGRVGLWLGPDNLPAPVLRRLQARLALDQTEIAVERRPLG